MRELFDSYAMLTYCKEMLFYSQRSAKTIISMSLDGILVSDGEQS